MILFDRLYGELRFPYLIQKVLDCPGLLRLREVRMANIPFFAFPSFASTNRYEHSLGVCHLAGIFAKNMKLSEKDAIELMLAALYHDVATPPFAHAVEEVLSELYGFNHERKLKELILGQNEDLGRERFQLFQGRSLKLHKLCQSKEARNIGIDIFRIADLAVGSKSDPFGDVICSKGIDLDNVDNVIRAVTAMGVQEFSPRIAEDLARSFIYDGNSVYLDESGLHYINSWKKAREILYGLIYSSVRDISIQTMLKHALHCLTYSDEERRLKENDWSFTDDELIYNRLLHENNSSEIIKRIRLGQAYSCLAFILFEGENASNIVFTNLHEIENIGKSIFYTYIKKRALNKNSQINMPIIISNAFLDQRYRYFHRPVKFFDKERQTKKNEYRSSVFVGLFTPYHKRWDIRNKNKFINKLISEFESLRIREVQITREKYPNVKKTY